MGWAAARHWTLGRRQWPHDRRLKARRSLATHCRSGTAQAAYSAAPDSGRPGANRYRYAPPKPAHQTCSSRRSLRSVRDARPPARLNGRRQLAIRPLPGDEGRFEPFLYGDYLWARIVNFVEFRGMQAERQPQRGR